jgi:hypothetical protein
LAGGGEEPGGRGGKGKGGGEAERGKINGGKRIISRIGD